MTIEQNSNSCIGFDKLSMYISLKKIDAEKLLNKPNVVVYYGDSSCGNYKYCHQGNPISYIKIKDNSRFLELEIKTHMNESTYDAHYYCEITLTVHFMFGNNLYPATYDQYSEYMLYLERYIEEEYGLSITFSNAKITYVELTMNVYLAGNYDKYIRVLDFLFCLPRFVGNGEYGNIRTMSKDAKKRRQKQTKTFNRANGEVAYLAYDKIEEMIKHKELSQKDLEHNILRIEFQLKSNDKICGILGTRYWNALSDAALVAGFKKIWEREFLQRIITWKQERRMELKRMYLQYRNRYKNDWHHHLIENIKNISIIDKIPYILDICQVTEVIEATKKEDKNYKRRIKALSKTKTIDDVYWNGDLDNLQEIIDYIDNIITP